MAGDRPQPDHRVRRRGLTTLIGVPASYGLVRCQFPGREWINIATLMPIIIPEMVIGIALLLLCTGMGLQPSLPLLINSRTMLTLPLKIGAVSASLHALDTTMEEAGRGLGASPVRAFLTGTLRPSRGVVRGWRCSSS